MASISERIYIRWLPDEAKEPTSTIVTTSAKSFFVDLRILLNPQELYWGFSGISYKEGSQGRWIHTVDSRYDKGTEDSGSFEEMANGDVLEKGTMLDFDDGKVKDYEEVWRDHDIVPKMSTVLVLEEAGGKKFGIGNTVDAARGMVIRVGNYCQGIMNVKGEITCERWILDEGEAEWKRVFRTGSGVLPCRVACIDNFVQGTQKLNESDAKKEKEKEKEEEKGEEKEDGDDVKKFEVHTEVHDRDEVKIGDYKWRVVEKSTW